MASPLSHTQQELLALAARLIVEEGMEYGPAKRRAVRQLGLPSRTPLPNNDALEDEVRSYIDTFCPDTQPAELSILREIALRWMKRMAEFTPYLCGAVWHGTATRHSDVHIELFCDDPKQAELSLLDHHEDFEPGSTTGRQGKEIEVLTVAAPVAEWGQMVLVHMSVNDRDDLRGALRPDARGRTPRGSTAALESLMAETD